MGHAQFSTAGKRTATSRAGYVKDLSRVKNEGGIVSQFRWLIFTNPNGSL
ncbi:hypothetical protein GEOBRER4_n0626 [Citrifermentans bremense]|uniref:Uncharacterized protein n=1 Tax=Citrifermentans bremense TaxID=60035 RepID=A0A7R7FRW3_9BACT|nr:hypothetical protein GEOBRER4_n0626 [Citrifermentans bremense]